MTGDEAWADLLNDTDGEEPSSLDVLDYIASYAEGWAAQMATRAYGLAIVRACTPDRSD